MNASAISVICLMFTDWLVTWLYLNAHVLFETKVQSNVMLNYSSPGKDAALYKRCVFKKERSFAKKTLVLFLFADGTTS